MLPARPFVRIGVIQANFGIASERHKDLVWDACGGLPYSLPQIAANNPALTCLTPFRR